jgi:hypothetical protein
VSTSLNDQSWVFTCFDLTAREFNQPHYPIIIFDWKDEICGIPYNRSIDLKHFDVSQACPISNISHRGRQRRVHRSGLNEVSIEVEVAVRFLLGERFAFRCSLSAVLLVFALEEVDTQGLQSRRHRQQIRPITRDREFVLDSSALGILPKPGLMKIARADSPLRLRVSSS